MYTEMIKPDTKEVHWVSVLVLVNIKYTLSTIAYNGRQRRWK